MLGIDGHIHRESPPELANAPLREQVGLALLFAGFALGLDRKNVVLELNPQRVAIEARQVQHHLYAVGGLDDVRRRGHRRRRPTGERTREVPGQLIP